MEKLQFNGNFTFDDIFRDHKSEIYESLIKIIKDSLDQDKVTVMIIQLNSKEYSINLTQDKYEKSLNNALSHFESLEEYEKCQECVDLLNSLKNNTQHGI